MQTLWTTAPFSPANFSNRRCSLIGELATQRGLLTTNQVDFILREQRTSGVLFGELGHQLGLLTQQELHRLITIKLRHDESLRRRYRDALHIDVDQSEREQYQQILFDLSDILDQTITVFPRFVPTSEAIVFCDE